MIRVLVLVLFVTFAMGVRSFPLASGKYFSDERMKFLIEENCKKRVFELIESLKNSPGNEYLLWQIRNWNKRCKFNGDKK